MRVRFDEDARREYLDAMVFYSESGEKIGVKFADAVELAIAKIGSEPHRFREIEAGVRRQRVALIDVIHPIQVGRDENVGRCAGLDLFLEYAAEIRQTEPRTVSV